MKCNGLSLIIITTSPVYHFLFIMADLYGDLKWRPVINTEHSGRYTSARAPGTATGPTWACPRPP